MTQATSHSIFGTEQVFCLFLFIPYLFQHQKAKHMHRHVLSICLGSGSMSKSIQRGDVFQAQSYPVR
jgi:hypothetical protein